MVVDYRRVNARTLRAVYYVRRSDDLKMEAAGSLYLTFLDAVTGFNHVVNTPRARRMLAIIARSGQFLPVCLTFGPVNGPEDFAYVTDRSFAPGRHAKRRFCTEWLAYVDDLTVRTGRILDGVWYTDEEVTEKVRQACRERSQQQVGQTPEEALKTLGFDTKQLGAETPLKAVAKKTPKAKPKAMSTPKSRASPKSAGRSLMFSVGAMCVQASTSLFVAFQSNLKNHNPFGPCSLGSRTSPVSVAHCVDASSCLDWTSGPAFESFPWRLPERPELSSSSVWLLDMARRPHSHSGRFGDRGRWLRQRWTP